MELHKKRRTGNYDSFQEYFSPDRYACGTASAFATQDTVVESDCARRSNRSYDVPVSYFFDDMPPEIVKKAKPNSDSGSIGAKFLSDDPLLEPVSVDLVRAYTLIENAQTRKSMFNLAKALAKEAGPESSETRKKQSA